MIVLGHLGDRVSALLDGQMSEQEQERAWAHVHGCHQCRDEVEREGWVKTRLAGLTFGTATAPPSLKGSLLAAAATGMPPGEVYLASAESRSRRTTLVALGGSAAGAAVVGVLALGVGPADAPTNDRRAPVSSVNVPTPAVLGGATNRRPIPLP